VRRRPAGTLYLHGESFRPPDELALRHIVGLIDDDTNLHKRLVYGHRVLGGTRDLARVIGQYRVDEIVLTPPLDESARRHVLETARQQGVAVFESRTDLVEVSEQ